MTLPGGESGLERLTARDRAIPDPFGDQTPRVQPTRGRRAWRRHVYGPCASCGKPGLLIRHHVLNAAVVRRLGGDLWDLRNSLLLGWWQCDCHERHHGGGDGRLPVSIVSAEAVEFAVGLLGEGRARAFLAGRYLRV